MRKHFSKRLPPLGTRWAAPLFFGVPGHGASKRSITSHFRMTHLTSCLFLPCGPQAPHQFGMCVASSRNQSIKRLPSLLRICCQIPRPKLFCRFARPPPAPEVSKTVCLIIILASVSEKSANIPSLMVCVGDEAHARYAGPTHP